jgi:hypothetical protein
MDELLHHCLRELSFDGDLGESIIFRLSCERGRDASGNMIASCAAFDSRRGRVLFLAC